jgi:hypothetical protein
MQVALTACVKKDYVQSTCAIDEKKYAIISMKHDDETSKPNAFESNIQFGHDGIVVRFPPIWYGSAWSNTIVEVNFAKKDSPDGTLILRQISPPGTQIVGTVERSCWVQVRGYINRQIKSRGTEVHLLETSGAQ